MRTLLFQAIVTDGQLNSLGVTDDSSFAIDMDTPENRPFLQLRWGTNDPGLDVVTQRNLTIWVHDQPGDYGRIDAIISRLRSLVISLVAIPGENGWLMGATWTGDSEDLTDDGHRTITRNISFVLVGSGQ